MQSANILVIQSSPAGGGSFTRQLTQKIVQLLQAKHTNAQVTIRDLVAQPLPHLGPELLAALYSPDQSEHKDVLRESDAAIDELVSADFVVLGVPMHNFSIPSVLKAWIDHVARAGRTFHYKSGAPEGLVTGKKVYLALASGGVYSDGPMKQMDFVEPYLRAILGFLGMRDVTVFRADGIAMPDSRATALDKGLKSIVV